MIYYERPIGFTAYRFLTLAEAWVSDPTLWVTRIMNSVQATASLFTTVYTKPQNKNKNKNYKAIQDISVVFPKFPVAFSWDQTPVSPIF